jgi:cobalt/nickel transport system permease protein
VHVPDGFIAPQVYLPAYAVAGVAWALAARRLRADLDERTLPMLAVVTALAFVLSTLAIPLPFGTTVHATGIGLMAVLFGPATAFLALSLVLVLQAFLLGAGGVTSLPINALAMGGVGAGAAWLAWRGLRARWPRLALFAAGALGVLVSSTLVALVLGLQPEIARREDGTPLFFPYGLGITLPAILLPNLVLAAGEGALTLAAYRFLTRLRRRAVAA